MKGLRCTIAALVTVTSFMSPALQASARPVEPDYPCYMQTTAGRVVDLTPAMCGGDQTVAKAISSTLFTNTSNTTGTATDKLGYDPRYRGVRQDVKGGVTTVTSGGAIDGTLYGRNGVRDNLDGKPCNTPDDRYSLENGGSRRCGKTAASERPGGR